MPFHMVLIWYWLRFDQCELSAREFPHSWALHSTLSSFPPIWTFSVWVIIFHRMFIPYWPCFDKFELPGSALPFDPLPIWYWPLFDQFELSGSAYCHSIHCWFDTDLFSIDLTLRKCVMPFHMMLIWYWLYFDQFKLSACEWSYPMGCSFHNDLASSNWNA